MREDTTASEPRDLPLIRAQVRGSVIGLFRGLDVPLLDRAHYRVSE